MRQASTTKLLIIVVLVISFPAY
ncbi:hypothetical protein ACLK18_11825 [Escherichia coli]